ncbi:25966_t:CDS:2, partial [Racocetra persica]
EAFKTRDRDNYSKIAQEIESLLKTEEKEEPKEETINKDVSSSIVDKIEDLQKEAKQATTRDELALDSLSFRNNNKENNSPQENI